MNDAVTAPASIRPVAARDRDRYLQDLFTDETCRGQGVGRTLIEAVYERAREGGAERVYWLTQNGNSTARRLYDKVADESGFVVYRKVIQK